MNKKVKINTKIVDTLISFDILMDMLTEDFMTDM